ncbi:baseplate J/gp47 family protein [Sorangium sp. So ce1078]|uniref:baseplate J/gp47 family protein n=1 Tax=Sorangium sp. So ce1078 TaxID=3133329 RepID=UPI003F61DEE7
MSIEDIIQNMVSQLGQSQDDRLAEELRPDFARVDERTPLDLLQFTKALSRFVNFHPSSGGAATDWQPFFAYDAEQAARLLEDESGATPAHLALLIAFLKLHELPREALNRITGRHLDFHYRRVLRFEPRPAVPDRAHVLVELKKNAAPVRVLPEHALSAGKDATGVERVYQPVRETVIRGAKIDELRAIFVDSRGRGAVRCAPVADSSDGMGGPLPDEAPGWRPFGGADLPAGDIGFALSAPVLRLREGRRRITLSLSLGNVQPAALDPAALAGALEAFVTGEKSWLGPHALRVSRSGDLLRLELELPETEGAVVDHDPAVHGAAWAARAPIVQVLLKPGAPIGYLDLRGLVLRRAQISVEVEGMSALALESDAGALDPKRTFLPFGPQPVRGSRFMIGCAEALSKTLSQIQLRIRWHNRPYSFATHYRGYGLSGVDDSAFRASVVFQDGGSATQTVRGVRLFQGGEDESVLTLAPGSAPAAPPVSEAAKVYAFGTAGTAHALRKASALSLVKSRLAPFRDEAPAPRSGYITLSLEQSFHHDVYRQKTVENVIKYAKAWGDDAELAVLKEPYTPAIQGISLAYKAHTGDVPIDAGSADSFAGSELRFFHVGCFGARREHGHLREQLEHVAAKAVPLLPAHDHEGELLLGVTGLKAGDSVSLLFQVAEGSADPDVAWPAVRWFALCDNHWKELGPGELVLDTTSQLRSSGLVVVVVPRQATTDNTLLPSGRLWLKAAVDRAASAVTRLVSVATNGVEVRFHDRGNDPAHLAAPLPGGSIGKLKTPLAAVKAVRQPHASFGGRGVESSEAMVTRASERLRHKNRCLTAWDYERIVLGAFPGIHKVKCIPHARDGVWHAPGHVLLVVVPDLRNQNARDPLQPRVDADTLARVAAHVQARAGMQVAVQVKNPAYQKVRLDFKVKLRAGYEPNAYRALLEQELIAFLSPWAHDAERAISFGGRIYRSVLLDFVEERAYVDYVTDFKMYSTTGTLQGARDVGEIQAERPDAILVSDATHAVMEAP